MSSIRRKLSVAAVALSLVLLGLGQPSAIAATTTATSTITLEGASPTQNHGTFSIMCDECLPDDFFDCGDGCEIAARAEATPMTSVDWTAPVSIDTLFDPDELHQGATADVSNVLTPGAGTITLHYEVPWIAGVFGRNGDFPPGPGWTPSTDTISDTAHVDVPATCTPPLAGEGDAVCAAAPISVNLLDEWPNEFAPVDITLDLVFNHTFTIGPDGIDLSRAATFEPSTSFTFNGPAPSVVADEVDIPCSAAPGTPVEYTLGSASYSPSSVVVTGSAGLHYNIDGPGPANAEDTVTIISGPVFDSAVAGNLAMAGGPADTIALGAVQADNVTPTVTAITQSGTFVEGSDVTFSAVVADNCPAGLTYQWQFSDGGVAFGPVAHHTFADNSTNYSGLLRVRDQANNQVFEDFDVQDIANADPNVTGPPDATALWGVPVSFHASAVDPGPADQPTLAFTWSFGDGTSAAGADVTHAYTAPGLYPVSVSVADKDGGVGTAGLSATIAQRATTLVYTGATQGLPNKYTTLSATLSDELGQPVAGRTVSFTLGSQTASAVTDSSGVASMSVRLNQKIGTYPLSAAFVGDSHYVAHSTGVATYRIGK